MRGGSSKPTGTLLPTASQAAVRLFRLTSASASAGSIGRPIRGDRYGKLLGYWSTELGPLNQVVHLWEYPDLAARAAARAGLARDERWTKEYLPVSGPLLESQENMILTPFDWAPFVLLGDWSPVTARAGR